MQTSICSYSFHRLLAKGQQDIYRFITDCKQLGCTQLDPWNAHLDLIVAGDKAITPDRIPAGPDYLSEQEKAYLHKVNAAAGSAGLPFGCIAVDGAHIYDADPAVRQVNRIRAYRWIEAAGRLGAAQIRIDAGGAEGPIPDDVFAIIREGYRDLIDRAARKDIQIVVENHWGPTKYPDNIIRLMENIPGLGFLLDTHNWRPELKEEGRRRCAKYATATHVKALAWDGDGNEIGEDLITAIRHLLHAGYKGCWGVESCPADGDEYAGVRKSLALIRRVVDSE